MQAKLRQLMKHEGINSTRLAEMLGIQASGISHIMSGRNKPSFDFLLKLLQRFPQLNPDWLLLDKGPMYRDEIKQRPGAGNSSGQRSVGVGVASAMGATGASGGLFEPDNNDIISAGGTSGSHSGHNSAGNPDVYPSGHPGAHPAGYPGQPLTLQQSVQQKIQQLQQQQQQQQAQQQAESQTPPQSPQQTPQPSQPAMYQSGGFKRSALIERIVVFYKDKTFSEYQPE